MRTIREWKPKLDRHLTFRIGHGSFLIRFEGKQAYEFTLDEKTALELLSELVKSYPEAVISRSPLA